MNKSIIVFLAFVALLFLGASCDKTDNSGEKTGPFFGGTKGITTTFVSGNPPSKFNDDQNVPVKILLKNEGEYDLKSGDAKVKLIGLNPSTFDFQGNFLSNSGNLRGKSELLLEGGEQEVNFGDLKYLRTVTNSQTFKLRAKTCYPYQTEARIPVCIKSTQLEETGDEIECEVSGEKVTSNSVSSAPVQVTSLEEELLGSDRIKFTVMIGNAGIGDVHNSNLKCDDIEKEPSAGKNEVNLEILDTSVKCFFRDGTESNRGIVEINGQPLTCSKEVKESFEDVLTIKLDYKYIDRTEFKDIEIVES